MAEEMVVIPQDKVSACIPYLDVCAARYGPAWGSVQRKRRWVSEFTEAERRSARLLFLQSLDWAHGTGVPLEMRMPASTLALWQKLGAFCASL